MAFLPDSKEDGNSTQVYCGQLNCDGVRKVRFSDDIIFARGKRAFSSSTFFCG